MHETRVQNLLLWRQDPKGNVQRSCSHTPFVAQTSVHSFVDADRKASQGTGGSWEVTLCFGVRLRFACSFSTYLISKCFVVVFLMLSLTL